MIRHLFKLMWNRKRRNMLLMIEMLISFIVIFAIASTIFGWGLQYMQPLGFDPENLWVLNVSWEGKVEGQTNQEAITLMKRLEQEAKAFDQVAGVCWTYGNTPYSNSTWYSGLEWKGQHIRYQYIKAGDDYAKVLRIPLIEGSWFGPEYDGSPNTPVVINEKLREILFGPDGQAVGQILTDEGRSYIVTGVIDQYRYKGDLDYQYPIFFERLDFNDSAAFLPTCLLIRVKPGTGITFEKNITDYLSGVVPGWTLRIEDISDLRSAYFKSRYMALLIPAVLGGFLIFNVALGLFGVLWYSINRRRSELGLRRALGATKREVRRQIVGESIVMALFAIVVGTVLAVHAPIFDIMGPAVGSSAYLLAISVAAALICLLVLTCAWYPANLAARVHPATALHDE